MSAVQIVYMVQQIGEYAFAGCTSLQKVIFMGQKEIPSCSTTAFENIQAIIVIQGVYTGNSAICGKMAYPVPPEQLTG